MLISKIFYWEHFCPISAQTLYRFYSSAFRYLLYFSPSICCNFQKISPPFLLQFFPEKKHKWSLFTKYTHMCEILRTCAPEIPIFWKCSQPKKNPLSLTKEKWSFCICCTTFSQFFSWIKEYFNKKPTCLHIKCTFININASCLLVHLIFYEFASRFIIMF